MNWWIRSRYIPLVEAARLCRVPERTLRRWVAEGRLTSDTMGRTTVVDPLEVAELQELRDTPSGRLPRSQAC